jgi:hypothetical protein
MKTKTHFLDIPYTHSRIIETRSKAADTPHTQSVFIGENRCYSIFTVGLYKAASANAIFCQEKWHS